MLLCYTNRKVTMVAGVSFRNIKNGNKARMVKKSAKLSPQSTSHVPFFASPDGFPVLATQEQLEYEKEPWKKREQDYKITTSWKKYSKHIQCYCTSSRWLDRISYLVHFVPLTTASMTRRKISQRSTTHRSIIYSSTVTGVVTWWRELDWTRAIWNFR